MQDTHQVHLWHLTLPLDDHLDVEDGTTRAVKR